MDASGGGQHLIIAGIDCLTLWLDEHPQVSVAIQQKPSHDPAV
jgi:hypothetical protein